MPANICIPSFYIIKLITMLFLEVPLEVCVDFLLMRTTHRSVDRKATQLKYFIFEIKENNKLFVINVHIY